ncbi:Thiol-disulfide oxidoreductase ResA [Dyadobacter sp. CECT 9275]|uniref:Thiol-disulfide oxidoreductase ResA n=1 Tax=Dyadobacter helix TaxID=2822344 RepID=A0A916JHS3_9BACT|nr:TlpA disulfide reductase family protein [Dyadobacter sp. CECT 9275]CAG5018269.1 Thiol-disulfide oxidoreductase ResA [Dyadobacter sp. CECT 9275]
MLTNLSGVTAQQYKLMGHILGLGRMPVIFSYSQNGNGKSDTVFASDDRFVYLPKPSDDGLISIYITGGRYTHFWYEATDISLSGNIEKPYQLHIEGGALNTMYNKYQENINWFYLDKKQNQPDSLLPAIEEEKRRATVQFIRENRAVYPSAYLLYWLTIRDERYADDYEKMFENLSNQVRNSYYGKKLTLRFETLRNQPVVGRKAPPFSLTDSKGQKVQLSAFKGKYVLLDFWGHWCSPCIKSIPALKNINEKYAGKLTIIGIAAENADDKQKWLKTIETHKLNWTQLSEFEGGEGEVNTKYNILQFPTYLVLNKEGTVVGRTSAISELEEVLKSINDF